MSTAAASAALAGPDRYRVLTVRGRDAASFLQGQLTRDVAALGEGELGLAALLTPQGRVVATPWLARRADGYDLVLPAALAPAVCERLQRFVLRAKVTLALLAPDAGPGSAAAPAATTLALVRAGLPEVGVEASEEWIPQMLNLDLVGAISFQKGCYTGQEIVARTQHLGRIKRRMFRLAVAGGAPPAVKAALLAAGAKVGEVVLAAAAEGGAECLAVLNLDACARPLALADGRGCRLLPLPYAVA
jgi:folate-binding protein YgfZ